MSEKFCTRCDGRQRLTAHSVPCTRCGGTGYEPEGSWITLRVDRALYLDEGRERVLCDRLPSPATLVLKLPPS